MQPQVVTLVLESIGEAAVSPRDVIIPEGLEGTTGVKALIATQLGTIPLVGVIRWTDDRRLCKQVRTYLADPTMNAARAQAECIMWRQGPEPDQFYCGTASGPDNPVPCLFDEPLDSEAWQAARETEPIVVPGHREPAGELP